MKHVLRWAFNLLAALSLLLCVAACVLWAWSYRAEIHYGPAPGLYYHRPSAGIDRGTVYAAWPEEDTLGGNAPALHWGASAPGTLRQIWGPPDWRLTGVHEYYGCRAPDVRTRFVAVPLWAVAALLLCPPLVCARPWRRLRSSPGLCRACGYDLRATPGRCPECGAKPAKAPPGGS